MCAGCIIQAQEYRTPLHRYEFTSNGELIRAFTRILSIQADSVGVINILSLKDGSTIKRIVVNNLHNIVSLAYSDDDSTAIVVCSTEPYGLNEPYHIYDKGPQNLSLKKISFSSEKPCWEIKTEIIEKCLECSFINSNQDFMVITKSHMLVFDVATGKIKRDINTVASFIDFKPRFSAYSLSRSGRYFAFCNIKYFTFSQDDDGGFATLLDLIWYIMRWFFSFGNIPNTLYIYDTQDDKMVARIQIPYESTFGAPTFTYDEKEILAPSTFNGKSNVYSIPSGKKIREIVYPKEALESFSFRGIDINPRYISKDNKTLLFNYYEQSYQGDHFFLKFKGFIPKVLNEKYNNLILGYILGNIFGEYSDVALYDSNSDIIIWSRNLEKELKQERLLK